MELFLNFLWVLIALGALATWRIFGAPQERLARRHPFREWAAFACAAVFLFFAISLTDDLHFNPVLVDEGASSRRISMVSCSVHSSTRDARTLTTSKTAALPKLFSLVDFSYLDQVWLLEPSPDLCLGSESGFARAPPPRLL